MKKNHYYALNIPNYEPIPIYSVSEVKGIFDELFVGKAIRTIFLSVEGYENAEIYEKIIDCSIFSGHILLDMKEYTVGLYIYGKGLMAYNIFPPIEKIVVNEESNQDENTESYCDIGQNYKNEGVELLGYKFETTVYPAFCKWDRTRLSKSIDLPNKLILEISSASFVFACNPCEYFHIETIPKE